MPCSRALLLLALAIWQPPVLAERLADDDELGLEDPPVPPPPVPPPLASHDREAAGRRKSMLQTLITDDDRLQPAPPGMNKNLTMTEARAEGDREAAEMAVGYEYGVHHFWMAACSVFCVWVAGVVAAAKSWFQEEICQPEPKAGKEGEEPPPPGETSWRRGFQPPALEAKWLAESFDMVIATGAKMIFGAAFGFFVYRAVRFERRSHPGSCLPVNWGLALTELGSLVVVMALAFFCVQKPSALYWGLLCYFFFYVLACALPPFAFSCTDLIEQCRDTDVRYIKAAVRHADCSLEGNTSQQTLMTWILVFPWSIPRANLMPLAWAWLVVVYFGWTMLYRHFLKAAWKTFSGSTITFHFALLNMAFAVAWIEKATLERMQRMTFLADLRLKEASRKLFNILKYMVPVHVILPMIQRPGEVIAEQIDRVSVLFIVIDEFEKVAESLTPKEVLAFLNDYFTKFDDIFEHHKVTKIETVGEEYVACVGVMPEDVQENLREGHSKSLGRLITAADEVLKLQSETVRFKMGLHTGPIVAGVIGTRLPRYRLFGDTINTAARLMQKGQVGQMQFGEETHKDLPQNIEAKLRGEVELKGKGQVKAYFCEKVHQDEGALAPTLRPKRASVFAAASSAQGEPGAAGEDGAEEATYAYVPAAAPSAAEAATAAAAPGGEVPDHDSLSGHGISLHEAEDEAFEGICASCKENGDVPLEGGQLEAWKTWHHQNKVCGGKVTPGLNMQLAVLAILTLVEVSYMYRYGETERSNSGIPAWARLPLFLACRLAVLGLILMWRAILESEAPWVMESGTAIMWGREVTWIFIAVILFISYDDLTPDDVAEVKAGEALVEIAPFSQNFSLVFVLVYTIVTRMEGMRFAPSTIFIAIAAMLMVNADYWDIENLVRSMPAKFFFGINAVLASMICYADEQTSQTQYKAKVAMEATTERVQGILSTLMPPLVLEELRSLPPGAPQPTHVYKFATICQSDLCGFTKLSATRTPREVVGFMGELFGRFDELTTTFGVYKVETVGDAYIAGTAEAPLTATNTPISVLLFSLAMIEAVHAWARNLGERVTCRVGVHYGECIGGVVGTGMQRYHLFGKLLCGMEILESTAPEGHVQISPACKAMVESQDDPQVAKLIFSQREEPNMTTSKGVVHEYESVGGRTFVVTYDGDITSMM